MNRKHKSLLPAMAFVVLIGLQLGAINAFAQGPGPGGPGAPGPGGPRRGPALPPIPLAGDTTHSLTKHFTPSTVIKKAPDAKGFIQRWLVLDPIKKNIRTNSALSESYLRAAFASDNFSQDYNALPKNGETVKIGGLDLKWRALDSKTFNFNLFHFSYATDQARAGVMFWLVTVINCPEEIKNVRIAAGVNSGGAFWLNGKEALMLPGDKDIIVDYATSPLLTLKKGRNIIRTAVVNGQGMCNFCVRFLDEKGSPVKNFNISYE